jgi:hypothetical protein
VIILRNVSAIGTHFAFINYLKKWEFNVAVHQIFTDTKKVYDLFRRDLL